MNLQQNDWTLAMGLLSSRSKSELCRPKFVVKSPKMLSYVARSFITLTQFPVTLRLPARLRASLPLHSVSSNSDPFFVFTT